MADRVLRPHRRDFLLGGDRRADRDVLGGYAELLELLVERHDLVADQIREHDVARPCFPRTPAAPTGGSPRCSSQAPRLPCLRAEASWLFQRRPGRAIADLRPPAEFS